MKLLALMIPLALVAQQRDASAPTAAPAGTASITGVVTTSDADPQPLRRAVVTLGGAIDNPRSVLSDDAGRFTFDGLPAGTFTVVARKAAYLAAPYGAKKPGRSGTSIVLGAGQRADISIVMYRGAAIGGMLHDADGNPVAGVDVRAIDARTLLTVVDSSPVQLATTDDRGMYRIYGLLPGDYFIVALPLPAGAGEVLAPSSSELDASLAALTARQGGLPAPGVTPPAQPPRPVGYAPLYYPGSWNYRDAARVHLDAGDERAGVNFALAPLPMAAIDGVVSGDVANLSTVQVSLVASGPRVSTVISSNGLSGRPVDAEGHFRYSNLPPGSYRIVARARRGGAPGTAAPAPANALIVAGAGRGGTSPVAAGTGEYLYGAADVELRGADATVSVALRSGGTLSGRIVFNRTAGGITPDDVSKAVRITLSTVGGSSMVMNGAGLMMGNGIVSAPPATIAPDGTFEIRNIGPSAFTLGAILNSPADAAAWKLRSAVGGDRDLLDQILDLGPDIDLRDVVVTFADARTELSGTLQTGAGVVTTQYDIVAVPADRALWQPKSRRILSARPATDGRFVFADLPAGDYLIAAVSELDPLELLDPAILEQLASVGTPVKVREGEKNIQNLKIR